MDNRRLFLLFALVGVLYLIWNAWEIQFHPVRPPPVRTAAAVPSAKTSPMTAVLPPPPGVAAVETPPAVRVPAAARGGLVRVKTRVFEIVIDRTGGNFLRVALRKYRRGLGPKSPPVAILHARGKGHTVVVTGLEPAAGSPVPGPDAVYTSPHRTYRCLKGCRGLVVPLVWRGPRGIRVTKDYLFSPAGYVVRVRYGIVNAGASAWAAAPYALIRRQHVHHSASILNPQHIVYSGLGYDLRGTYRKLSYHRLLHRPFRKTLRSGWITHVDNYFLVTLIPPRDEPWRYFARVTGTNLYEAGAVGEVVDVPAGARRTLALRLYLGPKLQRRLAAVAPALRQTVDYGYMTILAEPLYDLLAFLESVVHNWGWAIVILTLLIKAVFFPLQRMSGTSMARMRALQPRMRALQERYAEDKARLTQAMMELYKKEKINPASGCLPVLVQFPIYIALYWVLLYSVELRHAPFVFWIRDLSSPDPYYILPVLYGVTMAVYQRLVPQMTADRLQARLLMVVVPIAVAGFSVIMPAGLVLYWFVGGIFNILQQWHINRLVGAARPRRA